MRVEVIKTGQGLTRYVLTDDYGVLIEPAVRFIRYKDMCGKARNTLKAYCYQLKAYYEFLEQKQKTVFEVTIDDIAGFVNWLRSPIQSVNAVHQRHICAKEKCENSKYAHFNCDGFL